MELSNGLVGFLFDDETGSLAQITDLGTGRDYLADPRGNRLFKLIVPTERHTSRPVYSHEPRPQIERAGEVLTLRFPGLVAEGRPTGVSATVTVRLPAGSHEALFSIELRNGSPYLVHEVHFPWVGGWTGIAGKGTDCMTIGPWRLDPHTAFPTHRTHTFGRYNQRGYFGGSFFLPFADLSGGGCGLSYCIYAKTPRVCGLLVEDLSPVYGAPCLSWAYVGHPFLRPGGTWQSPEIGVGTHRGDWHETVDRFRAFAESWWRQPPAPARLRGIIGFHNVQFMGFNGELYHDLTEIPAIARDGMRYGVHDLCVWDVPSQLYLRPDTGGFWETEPERLAALRQGLADAKALGCNTSPLLNLRNITRRCRLFEEMSSELKRSIYGEPIADSYPLSLNHAQWSAEVREAGGYRLCQSSPKFHAFALDVVRRTLDLGFTSLFIDQPADTVLCMDDSHGHASPDAVMEGAYQWIGAAAEMVRARDPEGYVVGELPELFNTQLLDLWWDWGKRDVKWEVIRYLLPGSLQLWCIDEHERDVLSTAFASGHLLSLMTHEVSGLLSDEPDLAEHVARLAKLRRDTAPYLGMGRFVDQRGLSGEGAGGYVHVSDAGLAVGLANSEDHEVCAKVRLSPEALGRRPVDGGVVHLEDGSVQPVPAAPGGDLTAEVKLPAYGAAVWCVPCVEARRGAG